MYIAVYKETFMDTSLNTIITSLSEGLRADITYADDQVYTLARLTAVIVKGETTGLFDHEYTGGEDTLDLIMELENGVREILEPDFDATVQNGAGIVAVLKPQV